MSELEQKPNDDTLEIKPPATPVTGASPQATDALTFTNAPNLLTLLRIAFVPIVVALLFLKTEFGDILAAVAFMIASLTDWFDGYIARKRTLVTVYGKLMDPLADKFLVVAAIVML